MKYLETSDIIAMLLFIVLLLVSFRSLFLKRKEMAATMAIIQIAGTAAFISYTIYNSSLIDKQKRDITPVDVLILSIPFVIAIVNGIRLFSSKNKG